MKYKEYLISQCSNVKEHQSQHTATTVDKENASLLTIEGSSEPVLRVYDELQKALDDLPLYEPLYVNDLSPADRYQRRRWISGIKLSFPIMIYKYAYGNHLGTLIYIWKLSENEPVDSTTVSKIFC